MNEVFKPIAKQFLENLGFKVLELIEKEGMLTPDFAVIGDNDKYTIELKEKGDDAKEISSDDERLLRGEVLIKTIPIGPRNRLGGIIREGVKQILQYDPNGESFRIIWLHSAGKDSNLHYKRFFATLYGIETLLSIRLTPAARECYYFHESAFYSWRNYLDGAILSYDGKVKLCINSLSPNAERFRKSELAFSMRKGLFDLQKLEESSDQNIMIADCEIDRKRPDKILNYLQEKYSIDHLRVIPMKHNTITMLVDDEGQPVRGPGGELPD